MTLFEEKERRKRFYSRGKGNHNFARCRDQSFTFKLCMTVGHFTEACHYKSKSTHIVEATKVKKLDTNTNN